MLYSLTYTEIMPPTSSGYAKAWFIYIRTHHKDDVGLHEHEKIHVMQFWRTFGLHPFLYKWRLKYRLKAEVEAYRIQLSLSPPEDRARRLDLYATWLSDPSEITGYGLTLSKQEAMRLLS